MGALIECTERIILGQSGGWHKKADQKCSHRFSSSASTEAWQKSSTGFVRTMYKATRVARVQLFARAKDAVDQPGCYASAGPITRMLRRNNDVCCRSYR